VPWVPKTPGQHDLVACLAVDTPDAKSAPAPVETRFSVDVAPVAEPPATLQRLQEVLDVIWAQPEHRDELTARLRKVHGAVESGDQAAARSALTEFRQFVEADQGKTIGGHDAARLSGLIEQILKQPTIELGAGANPPARPATPTPAAALMRTE